MTPLLRLQGARTAFSGSGSSRAALDTLRTFGVNMRMVSLCVCVCVWGGVLCVGAYMYNVLEVDQNVCLVGWGWGV